MRGPSFAAEDLVTRTFGSPFTPRFDPSAGVLGSGGVQPATDAPDTLSGSYTVAPAVREVSASVMVAASLDGSDGVPVADGSATSDSGVPFSPQSTAAAGSARSRWSARAAGPGIGPAAAGARAVEPARIPAGLTRSSVFLNTAAGTPLRLDPAVPADGASRGATALATVQGASSLTAYQASRIAAADPGASRPSGQTIEAYSVARPASAGSTAAVATVRLPIRVATGSYGFLNSSLTVFSDDYGTFAGIGQSFNGLTALDIAEPASVLVVLASLAGIAATRRRRRP